MITYFVRQFLEGAIALAAALPHRGAGENGDLLCEAEAGSR